MNVTLKVIQIIVVILGGLVAGYLFRRFNWLAATWSPRITRATLAYVQPFPIALAIWGLQVHSWRAILLPVFGAVLAILMLVVGALVARGQQLDRRSQAAFVLPTMFSNTGTTYGAFLCFVLMGAQGLALATIYTLSFAPMIYTVGFYVARAYVGAGQQSVGEIMRENLTAPHSRNPLAAILAGLLLWALPWQRPECLLPAIDILIPVGTAALLFAIGLSIRLRAVREYAPQAIWMHGLKFIVSPALGLLLAVLFGFWAQADHEFLKIVLIESAAPCAIMSLAIVQVFRLNVDLANVCWLTTNLTAIALAPILVVVAGLL